MTTDYGGECSVDVTFTNTITHRNEYHLQSLTIKEGASTLVGSLTCAERLPAGSTVILYPDPNHYKDVPREQRPTLRRVRAEGATFRIDNLAAGIYRVSVWAEGNGLRFSGRRTVEVQGTTRTQVAVKAAKLER